MGYLAQAFPSATYAGSLLTPVEQVCLGGFAFAAVFMATDYVTSPTTKLGNYIYFVMLGLLTAGLRIACKIEVVTFVVLLMNFIVPFLDKWLLPKPFGNQTKNKEAKA